MPVIFSKSVRGRTGVSLPENDVPDNVSIPENCLRTSPLDLCELSELDVVRHFTALSRKNYGVDTGFYPLGSCTMKYNPKVCEKAAGLDGFANLHPMLTALPDGVKMTQGSLAVIYELENLLCNITAMDAFTLTPMAGAHGELTGMMIIAAYHRKKGNNKTEVLIPDEAHGTNPSSAAVAGYDVKSIPTDPATGLLDIEKLKEAVNEKTAAIMMTNPNTLGLFNPQIKEIAALAHSFDAQLYYDGANLNAIMGKFRPGDGDFDVVHVNLHKTFAAPHGGGGPGSGPVGVKKHLEPFLPVSRVVKKANGEFCVCDDYPDSIGRVAPFFGNFLVNLKAYVYILMMGGEGLKKVSEQAVLSANYIMRSLKDHYDVAYLKTCMHECVLTAKRQMENGVSALDIAKALIDKGFHPPTIYFPLIVKEAMMIEPTETESKEAIDAFIEAMVEIAREAEDNPEALRNAPVSTPVGRLNETKAAKEMNVACL
ncbi:MAG: aminomethyl-transferring glycine dehydrogenase subunit GcvPB [Chitinispirillales bacterium]|jgi:glycine dehydrogenase subunit 2|nr:aminomethyl-transferring glycine dehydrogenase subunit GcvPB [Chitinispirillales bacterium]